MFIPDEQREDGLARKRHESSANFGCMQVELCPQARLPAKGNCRSELSLYSELKMLVRKFEKCAVPVYWPGSGSASHEVP